MAEKWTAHQVQQAVYRHFAPKWAVVFEVTARPEGTFREALQAATTTEEIDQVRATHKERRIDALLVRRTPSQRPTAAAMSDYYQASRQLSNAVAESAATGRPVQAALLELPFISDPPPPPPGRGDDGGLDRLALEIKVSRADFLQDVRHPEKQGPWRALAHRHAYVVPAGLVSPAEVPSGSGLLEAVAEDGRQWTHLRWTRKAPRAETAKPLPLANQLDAFHRWSRAEAITRGLDWDAREGKLAGCDEQTLRGELARVQHEVELLRAKVVREQELRETWRKRYAALEPPPCSTCGVLIRPARRGRRQVGGDYQSWEHMSAEVEAACLVLRTAEAEAREAAKPEGQRYRVWVLGPEPRYPEDDEGGG